MKQFVLCIHNNDYRVSLEPFKVYEVVPDPKAIKHKCVRVIDESGEDYVFPADLFEPVQLTETAINVYNSSKLIS